MLWLIVVFGWAFIHVMADCEMECDWTGSAALQQSVMSMSGRDTTIVSPACSLKPEVGMVWGMVFHTLVDNRSVWMTQAEPVVLNVDEHINVTKRMKVHYQEQGHWVTSSSNTCVFCSLLSWSRSVGGCRWSGWSSEWSCTYRWR